MATPRRRVSYIIPPPHDPVPRLQLPPRGSIPLGTVNPTLIYLPSSSPNNAQPHEDPYQHPRHRLGVASLALDTTTLLTGKPAPEGILYTGGRDGMLMSWDLDITMKKRHPSTSTSPGSGLREGALGTKRHWELITGWLDDSIDEEGSDSEPNFPVGSDGDVLGDVTSSLDRKGKHMGDLRARDKAQLEREREWVPDMVAFKPGTPSTFRQCAQTHTDWVNDILLCNFNQTLVSASADGTVKAWSPHVTENVDPATIGRHTDYVRCLTACPTQNWVASGSFDRTIKLWDLTRSAPSTSSPSSSDPAPLTTLSPPDSAGPKSSIYALSTDRYGTTIASGSPERVVRLWDPRAGRRTGKLVGHTDNIRAVLVSEDGKYLLTGSADASIKLWSLNTLRCLHTFTHHADSVWSLASTHPSLEVFYSGDRSGLLCRVDVEDCTSISDGECVVLCREGDVVGAEGTEKPEGINKIVTLDDQLVWTASGMASVRRWRVPPKRLVRAAMTDGEWEWVDKSPPLSESPLGSPTFPSTAAVRGHRNKGSMSLSRDTLSPPSFGAAGSVHSLSSANAEYDVTPQGRPISRTFSGGSAYDPTRMPPLSFGIALESLVRLIAPDYPPLGSATSAFFNRPRDPEVATLYSAASVMSIPHVTKPKGDLGHGRPPLAGLYPVAATNSGQSAGSGLPSHARSGSEDTGVLLNSVGVVLVPYEERELAMDAIPFVSAPDYTIPGSRGLVRCIILNTRMHALTVDTAGEVAVWDLTRCTCLGRFERAEVAAASHSGSSAGGTGERERGPRELLELVRERIEGEAVVTGWCTADTKTGVLAVHMTERAFDAEVYADEVGFAGDPRFTDESKLNIGKWVLRNLFWGFVKEEQRLQRKAGIGSAPGTARNSTDVLPPSLARGSHHYDDHHQHHQQHHHSHQPHHPHRHHREPSNDAHHGHHHHLSSKPSRKSSSSPESTRKAYRMAATLSTSSVVVAAPHIIPAVPPPFPTLPPPSPPIVTPSLIPLFPNGGNGDGALDGAPPLATPAEILTPTPHHTRTRSATVDAMHPATPTPLGNAKEADYFSARRGSLVPSTPDDFSGWGGPGSTGKEPSTPNTPGGFMGRLKSFKMVGRRPTSDLPQTPAIVNTPIVETPVLTTEPAQSPHLTAIQALLATPFAPANSTEAPHVQLPANTVIIIGEDSFPSYTTLYRGSTALTQYDTSKLEEAMPLWLLEYLLLNKLQPTAQPVKISFVLLPWKGDPDGDALPELLNTQQSKLTASRYLRVRKLVAHVQEKLDKPAHTPSASRTPSIRSSVDANHHLSSPGSNAHKAKPEDAYEILCNEALLPLDMNLGAVRQYVWRQGAELVMHYRRKKVAAV